ncbi:MAG TPA: hypothetical protein VGQ35_19230 [Dongiaceae bacterium]|jgi:hypothetical protein|nr:hypothetical protein [Dongiaceae bacterium]
MSYRQRGLLEIWRGQAMRDRAGTMGAHEIDVPQLVDARGRLAAFEADLTRPPATG